MDREVQKKIAGINKELLAVNNREKKLCRESKTVHSLGWKAALQEKIPEKVYTSLETAFSKGFAFVFKQGGTIIEKTYKKEELRVEHAVRAYAFKLKGTRRELKRTQRAAERADLLNMTATAVEGIGLGTLGIGMPDIVLFLGFLLKGIYETSLHYGFDYESDAERMMILKMMETSLSSGEDWNCGNEQVDTWIQAESEIVSKRELDLQIRKTASAFAVDMLLLKFIQGIPLVGIFGGAANPVYYSKVMRYVQLKYRKRYLLAQRGRAYMAERE